MFDRKMLNWHILIMIWSCGMQINAQGFVYWNCFPVAKDNRDVIAPLETDVYCGGTSLF